MAIADRRKNKRDDEKLIELERQFTNAYAAVDRALNDSVVLQAELTAVPEKNEVAAERATFISDLTTRLSA